MRTGRDPWRALGFPDDGGVIPLERALWLADLLAPRDEHSGMTQSEMDDAAVEIMRRMDQREAWTGALRTGYKGPRGPRPDVRALPAPPTPERVTIFL